jgi:hypothetical protein
MSPPTKQEERIKYPLNDTIVMAIAVFMCFLTRKRQRERTTVSRAIARGSQLVIGEIPITKIAV